MPVDIPGDSADTRRPEIYGELCLPTDEAGRVYTPETVQLLLHGVTYGTYYWDFPYEPGKYSYVDHMTRAGYATFNIDRIGNGRSSHPPSSWVTIGSNAIVASRLMAKLRDGELGGKKSENLILVGQSYGSAVAWVAQARHDAGNPLYPGGADATIATAWGHRLQREPGDRLSGEQATPAESDPRFAEDGEVYDRGYLTASPKPPDGYPRDPYADNAREKDYFYYLSEDIYDRSTPSGYGDGNDTFDDGVDPAVIARDAEWKQTSTQAETATLAGVDFDGLTRKIEVPSFPINGADELFWCGSGRPTSKNGNPSGPATDPSYYCGSDRALTDFEGRFFDAEARFEAAVVPETGHMLNLHKSARTGFGIAERFADRAVGHAVGPDGGQTAARQRAGSLTETGGPSLPALAAVVLVGSGALLLAISAVRRRNP